MLIATLAVLSKRQKYLKSVSDMSKFISTCDIFQWRIQWSQSRQEDLNIISMKITLNNAM